MSRHYIDQGAALPQELSDCLLIARILEGDQQAFEDLVSRYSTQLIAFVHRYIGDDELAYDVQQHVFLQLYLSLHTLRVRASVKPWLMQVARNRCLDELRKKRPLLFSELAASHGDEALAIEMLPDPSPLPQEVAEWHAEQFVLSQAIGSLPLRMRQVVRLRYLYQLSFVEIGRELAMPETTAKTYFHRSKGLLRARLDVQRLRDSAS